MTVKKAEPEKKNVPTTGTSGDGTIIGMLKAKDDEIKQMIKDQAKEYYENIQKEKAWEQKLSEEKQKVKELQKTRDDQERRISWIHEENIRLKQQQEWGKEQLIKEFEQKIEEARINEKEALKERISHLEERIKGYEEERFEREFPSLGRNANLLIALEEQMDEPRIKEHVANVILEMEVIKNTEVGQDSSRSKTRKVVNHLYNVTVEFDIPNCPFFKTKAIIDTGASSCFINKEVVPEEALELLTNFIKVNGLNSSQPAKHKIKGGMFAIEGNKFRIPLIYAFEMKINDGIQMLIGTNFIRAMQGGIRIEGDEITIYKKITKFKTSDQAEICQVAIDEMEMDELEYQAITEESIFHQEINKEFKRKFEPMLEELRNQGYIGEEPLKHWKKNEELCKLDIINPDITIEDKPLKDITPAMEASFKKHIDSLLKLGVIRPSKSRHRTMAMMVNSGTTVDPATGVETKGK
ncbi:Orf y, partial [Tanacetum coccineum]